MKKSLNINKNYLYLLVLFFVCSITSIYSFSSFLYSNPFTLVVRQVCFYVLGLALIFLILKIGFSKVLKYSIYIYMVNILLLLLVLFVGEEINGIKAWFNVPLFGSFQPSEFMKIGLVLLIAKVIDNDISSSKSEFILILKVLVIILIPSLITFLEPDTGAVLIYLIIGFVMLFCSGISYKWFILLLILAIVFGGGFFFLYLFGTDLFISIFGSNFFYRFDRILDWQSSSGMQLTNSLIAISSSGYFGNGISNILLYFPEGHTDFIFASFASIFGLFGILVLVVGIVLFDMLIIKTSKKNNDCVKKLVCVGFLGVFIYQQIQNICMTVGILPITGITLPFISYGGSSLISFMIILGIIIAIDGEKKTKRKKHWLLFY